MKDELSTANNIKSRQNRQSVQEALRTIIRQLKTIKQIPDNGMAIFAGSDHYV